MSNLKKVLSVGLASTMVMGMVATSAAAATYDKFADKDEIVNKDAVSMVTELGVIAGLPGGNYGPKQNIDRASFARLVCVALNGGQEPNLGNLKTTFTDTQGNWAEKYIAYCVQQGIIAGKGNNTFAPAANVTGSEAAKMLLVALGYNATYEKIGGATWQVTTDVLANQAGLYDGLEGMNTSEPLTRDNAAQMIYNTLNATKVKYEMVPGISANGQVTMTTQRVNVTKTQGGTTVDVTLLSDAFGVVTVEGVVVANEFANLATSGAKDEGDTVIKVTNEGDGQNVFANGNNTFELSTGADVLGKAVTLYVKPSTTASSNASKATVLGSVVVSSENNVVTASGTKTIAKLAKDNDLVLDTIFNGTTDTFATQLAVNYGGAANMVNGEEKAAATRGVKVSLIDNDGDDVVDYVIKECYDFGKVSKYSTKDDGSITISGYDALNTSSESVSKNDKADVVGFDDVKKGDYVLYAEIGGKLHVQKPETVEGKVTAYKKTDGTTSGTITVDGTKYTVSGLFGYNDSAKLTDPNNISSFMSGVFYLDKEGYIVAIGDAVNSTKDYALVLASTAASNGVDDQRVKVALSDGTVATYTLDECHQSDGKTDATVDVKKLYTYTLNDKEISLREIADGNYQDDDYSSATSVDFEKGKVTFNVNGTKYYADDSTVFFYAETSSNYYKDADVYVGKDKAPSIDDSVEVLVVTGDSNVAKAVVVVDAAAATNGDFLYLVKQTGTVEDGFTYTAIVGNEVMVGKTEITVKTSVGAGLYQYTVNADGVYEVSSMSAGTVVEGVITRDPAGKSIVIDAVGTTEDGEYVLNSDAVVTFIDGDDTYTEADLAEGDTVTIVTNSDREVEAVYVTANQDDASVSLVYSSVDFTVEDGVDDENKNLKVDLTTNDELTKDDFIFAAGSTAKWTIADSSNHHIAADDTVEVTSADGKTTVTYTFVQA